MKSDHDMIDLRDPDEIGDVDDSGGDGIDQGEEDFRCQPHEDTKACKACRVCGNKDSFGIKLLTRWPEENLCPVCSEPCRECGGEGGRGVYS